MDFSEIRSRQAVGLLKIGVSPSPVVIRLNYCVIVPLKEQRNSPSSPAECANGALGVASMLVHSLKHRLVRNYSREGNLLGERMLLPGNQSLLWDRMSASNTRAVMRI